MKTIMERMQRLVGVQRDTRSIQDKLEERARQVERAASVREETYAVEGNGVVFFPTREIE
ncbi:MAG TPA: hypothetical protein VF615_28105 [Longimicrobiaceae bacterium]|jgi:hypothetical protein